MTSENAAWLLQANPKEWDFGRFLADVRLETTDGTTTWLASRYAKEICAGDRAYVWMAGGEAGIYAVATVTRPAEVGAETNPGYAMPGYEEKYRALAPRIEIQVDRTFAHLRRVALRKNEGLEALSILQPRPQGTVFRVSPGEESILDDLCASRPTYWSRTA